MIKPFLFGTNPGMDNERVDALCGFAFTFASFSGLYWLIGYEEEFGCVEVGSCIRPSLNALEYDKKDVFDTSSQPNFKEFLFLAIQLAEQTKQNKILFKTRDQKKHDYVGYFKKNVKKFGLERFGWELDSNSEANEFKLRRINND